jgi:acetyl esterase
VSEGILDPWVARWLQDQFGRVKVDLATAARDGTVPQFPPAPTREIGAVADEVIEDVPVRIYEPFAPPTGVLVYFHGGGFCGGSVDAMDGFARELTYQSGAVVISVEYRLSPRCPYPAALDDCETVTRWAVAHSQRFGVPGARVAVGGESAGGNLAAAVTLRLRATKGPTLAGQVLMYPSVDGAGADRPSELEFGGLIVDRATSRQFWEWYSGGRDLDGDPFAVPLSAPSLTGLPPAIVILGGCDFLRDAGRLYSIRLRDDGVDVSEVCCAGQPHGFMNFMFPASVDAFARVGAWLRGIFARQA